MMHQLHILIFQSINTPNIRKIKEIYVSFLIIYGFEHLFIFFLEDLVLLHNHQYSLINF